VTWVAERHGFLVLVIYRHLFIRVVCRLWNNERGADQLQLRAAQTKRGAV